MGVFRVRDEIDERVLKVAGYIVENQDTVRGAALRFGCSKSTIHKYMTQRLESLDGTLYAKVRAVLDLNKAERHIRGGMATKHKYEVLVQRKENGDRRSGK